MIAGYTPPPIDPMPTRTFADEIREEIERLLRRGVHHTRPREPMTMAEAADLCRRMEGAHLNVPVITHDHPVTITKD